MNQPIEKHANLQHLQFNFATYHMYSTNDQHSSSSCNGTFTK